METPLCRDITEQMCGTSATRYGATGLTQRTPRSRPEEQGAARRSPPASLQGGELVGVHALVDSENHGVPPRASLGHPVESPVSSVYESTVLRLPT
jgi:hypothetical protein